MPSLRTVDKELSATGLANGSDTWTPRSSTSPASASRSASNTSCASEAQEPDPELSSSAESSTRHVDTRRVRCDDVRAENCNSVANGKQIDLCERSAHACTRLPRSLPAPRRRINILTIDGGGVRGIIPAKILAVMERQMG